MSLPITRPLDQASNGPSAVPFLTRSFDFSGIVGLSSHSLEVHRSLYEGYVSEANSLLPLVCATSIAPANVEVSATILARIERDGLTRRFAYERNGMVLHELFFEALRGRSDPPRATGVFTEVVEQSFGSYEAWQSNVRELAQTRGIGWVLTVLSDSDNRLSNIWIDGHSHGLLADARVVLAIDLWEHAYLIDFRPNERMQYLQTIFDNIDWDIVEGRCL